MQSHSRTFLATALALALIATAGVSAGLAQAPSPDPIYGSQLMTRQERSDYRDRMRNAKTAEERETVRAENHKLMSARAKERGVTLPDEPPATGMGGGMGRGTGPGGGMGQGMGPGGGGMGPGGARP
jgi:hypothetical protein